MSELDDLYARIAALEQQVRRLPARWESPTRYQVIECWQGNNVTSGLGLSWLPVKYGLRAEFTTPIEEVPRAVPIFEAQLCFVLASALLEKELHGILGSRLAAFARERGFEALAYAGDAHHLRAFLAKGRPLIVAEGYMDVIALAQAGADVALIGRDIAALEETLAGASTTSSWWASTPRATPGWSTIPRWAPRARCRAPSSRSAGPRPSAGRCSCCPAPPPSSPRRSRSACCSWRRRC